MYVRYQIPVDPKGRPITLIHGCCLTGKTWETTPDGRMGWDEYFLRKGRAVYVVDQVARGRSAADPSVIDSVKLGKTPPDQLPEVFSFGHEAAWTIFRFGPAYPKVYPGMRFPLDAIGEFWKQMVPDWASSLPTPNPTVSALSELAIRLDGTVLMSHSQSGIYPFQTAALNTKGIVGIVSIEPSACPDPSADLAPYTRLPILVLWGDYVELSPRWAPAVNDVPDVCRSGQQAWRQGRKHWFTEDRHARQLAHAHAGYQQPGNCRLVAGLDRPECRRQDDEVTVGG